MFTFRVRFRSGLCLGQVKVWVEVRFMLGLGQAQVGFSLCLGLGLAVGYVFDVQVQDRLTLDLCVG